MALKPARRSAIERPSARSSRSGRLVHCVTNRVADVRGARDHQWTRMAELSVRGAFRTGRRPGRLLAARECSDPADVAVRHGVEHGYCTGVDFARDCVTGCSDEDCALDAWQAAQAAPNWLPDPATPGVCLLPWITVTASSSAGYASEPQPCSQYRYSGSTRAAPALRSAPTSSPGTPTTRRSS